VLFVFDRGPSVGAAKKEFIALAKARPGELNFGTAGEGSSTLRIAELLNVVAGAAGIRAK